MHLPSFWEVIQTLGFCMLFGLTMTVLEHFVQTMWARFGAPWHVQYQELKFHTKLNGVSTTYLTWENVDPYGHSLESATDWLCKHKKAWGHRHYRLHNWITKEVIPGEVFED